MNFIRIRGIGQYFLLSDSVQQSLNLFREIYRDWNQRNLSEEKIEHLGSPFLYFEIDQLELHLKYVRQLFA